MKYLLFLLIAAIALAIPPQYIGMATYDTGFNTGPYGGLAYSTKSTSEPYTEPDISTTEELSTYDTTPSEEYDDTISPEATQDIDSSSQQETPASIDSSSTPKDTMVKSIQNALVQSIQDTASWFSQTPEPTEELQIPAPQEPALQKPALEEPATQEPALQEQTPTQEHLLYATSILALAALLYFAYHKLKAKEHIQDDTQLKEYIQKARAQNYTNAQIRDALKKAGWQEEQINHLLPP